MKELIAYLKEHSVNISVESYNSYMLAEMRKRLLSLSQTIATNNRIKWSSNQECTDKWASKQECTEDLLVSTPAIDKAMVDLSINLEGYIDEVFSKFNCGGSNATGRAVLNISPDVAMLLSKILWEYEYKEDVSKDKTIWETRCDLLPESSITAYARYLNVIYDRIRVRVQDYFLDNEVRCADGVFQVYDSPRDWSYFVNYVTQYLVEIFVRFSTSKEKGYIELSLNSVYEKYVLRYFLSTFKSDVGLRVLYNSNTDTLVLPKDCSSDIPIKSEFEQNYTSRALNLSSENFIGNLSELESCDLESYLLVLDKPNSGSYIRELLFKHPRLRKYYDTELM